MKRLLAAIVILWSCATSSAAGRRECVTPCGMHAPEGNCESLQRYEGRVLRSFARHVTDFSDSQKVCEALHGWTIRYHRHQLTQDVKCGPESWQLYENFCAAGLTTPYAKRIELGTLEWESSPLAHEIVHVLDTEFAGKTGHCRWADQQLLHALSEVSTRVETSGPETDCKK